MNWKSLSRQGWFFSPKLEAWQRKIVSDLQKRVPGEKHMAWVLSSGTQAVDSVKAIGLTHESILTAAAAANKHLRSSKQDRWLLAIPHYHIGGLSIFARAHLSGAKVSIFGPKWHPGKFATVVREEGITLTSLVPTQVHDLVQAKAQAPDCLRAIVVGGGALQPSLWREARALGWPVLPSYGLTECSSQVATASLSSLKHSEYPPLQLLQHVKVELREQRVLIQSKSLARWIAVGNKSGEFTLEDPKRGGWFATADAAEMEGRTLRILGRRDDVVKVLGVLVPVQEVEARAREDFALERFCVIARPDSRREHAFVLVTDSENSLRGLQKQLEAYNARAPGPFRIESLCWVPKLPINEMGKVRKAELTAALTNPASA